MFDDFGVQGSKARHVRWAAHVLAPKTESTPMEDGFATVSGRQYAMWDYPARMQGYAKIIVIVHECCYHLCALSLPFMLKKTDKIENR